MYHSILVGQDASEQSRHALNLAVWVARATNAHLHLIHLHGRKLPGVSPQPVEEMERLLDDRAATCADVGVMCSQRIVTGWATHALLAEARWHDLVVIGKHGASHGGNRDRLGSLTGALLGGSPVPVLIVDDAPAQPTSLLVAFDGSPDACKALRIAAGLALERGIRLHVVETVRSARRPDRLARAKEYLDDCPGLDTVLERIVGRPADTVAAYIDRHAIELTFLPALDRSLFGRRLTTHLATQTASSLLVPEGQWPPVY